MRLAKLITPFWLSQLALVALLVGCKHIRPPSRHSSNAVGSIGRAEQAVLDSEFVNQQVGTQGSLENKQASKIMSHHHGQAMIALADTRTYVDQMSDAFGKLYASYNGWIAARFGWKNWRDLWIIITTWGVIGVLGVVTGATGFLGISRNIMRALPLSNPFVWIRNWFLSRREPNNASTY